MFETQKTTKSAAHTTAGAVASTALEWNDPEGLLADFAGTGVVQSERHRDDLLKFVDQCLAEASDRSVGMDEDPVWIADFGRLRLLRSVIETATLDYEAVPTTPCGLGP